MSNVSKVVLSIDGTQVKCEQGSRILEAALGAGIYIPNLCFIREADPPLGACRLCFVEIEGHGIVTACTEPVREGMVVQTNTPRVNRLRRTAAELIIASHATDCRHCGKNRNCELQKVAAYLKVKLKPQRLREIPKTIPIDSSHPLFTLDPSKCVLCGKCVWLCNERNTTGTLDFAMRGYDTVVSTFGGIPLAESDCTSCMECVAVCPVGALLPKDPEWRHERETLKPNTAMA